MSNCFEERRHNCNHDYDRRDDRCDNHTNDRHDGNRDNKSNDHSDHRNRCGCNHNWPWR